MTEAYLCTGDGTWTQRIRDPPLKVFMLLTQELLCRNGRSTQLFNEGLIEEDLLALLSEAIGKLSIEEETRACLWDGVEVTLVAALCQEGSNAVLEIIIKILTISWCSDFPGADIFCQIGYALLNHTDEIKGSVGLYACDRDNITSPTQPSQRVKRQYDLSSMVELINQIVCKYPESLVLIVKESKMTWLDLDQKDNAAALATVTAPFVCCLVDVVRQSKYVSMS